MSDMTKENKAKLAVDSLMDSCKMLAELSKGMERKEGYDAYFVPETFWYNRVHLHSDTSSDIKETIQEVASRVRAGELPPLLSWNEDDFDKKEMKHLLLDAGYVPIVAQILMYISLEGRTPVECAPQVDGIQPEEAEKWSLMTAEAFAKPPETEGMKLLSTQEDCDFLVWRESNGDAAGEMLGGTLLICKDKNAGIHEVSTLPEHRRKGIGAALVNRAFDMAVEKGCTYATLQASELGSYLYSQLGMEEVGYLQNWILPRE